LACANNEPLAELMVGEVINVDGFHAAITSVEGSNGNFTGSCDLFVPFVGAKIQCTFKNITVTQSMQVSNGSIIAVRGPKVTFVGGGNSGGTGDDNGNGTGNGAGGAGNYQISGDTLQLNNGQTVDTVYVNNAGQIVIVDTNGNTIQTGKTNIVVNTGGGSGAGGSSTTNTYTVEDGKIVKTPGGGTTGGGTASGTGTANSLEENVRISFISPIDNQSTGGFDSPRYKQMINGGAYNTIQLNKQNYYIPWRSVEAGKSAFVVAEMAITSDTITTKNIEFVDANGLILSTSPAVGKAGSKSTFLKINLQAGNHQDVNRITAQYFRTDKDGKKHTTPLAYVNVISYNSHPVDLVIATANGNTPKVSASELQTELNHIYSQSVIQFKVSQIDLGTVDFDKNKDNSVDAGETGIISNYTAETRAFKRAVRKHQAYNKKHFYIVMVPQAEKTDGRASLQGRWALKTQVGFVFNPSSMSRTDFIRTVAHESGHGIFRLWHTFSANSKYIIPQGTTNNLMDYPSVTLSGDEGTDLYKHQWDFCHDPESMTGLFQDDSEGESSTSTGQYVEMYIKNIRCLKKRGVEKYFDESFKYNYGQYKYDSWSYPALFDDIKYGSIRVWYSQNKSVQIDISKIQKEGSFVYVGDKNGAHLKFLTRDNDYKESNDLAQKLADYLLSSSIVYDTQVNKYIKDLCDRSSITVIDEIGKMSECMLESMNARSRFNLFEKILLQDDVISESESICINRLFSTVTDKNQASELIERIKEKNYEKKIIKTITDLRSKVFSNLANGLSWLYYSQNTNTVITAGRNASVENFFAWEPLKDAVDNYKTLANNPNFSNLLDWVYNSKMLSYTVHLENDGRFRVHVMTSTSYGGSYHDNFYIEPFETVNVYFASKNKYINIVDNTVVMPGILLAWMIDQGERESNNLLLNIATTAVSFYLDGSAIINATGKAGKIINSILFVKGFTDLIVKSDIEEVERLLGRKFILAYKKYSNIINCGLIFKNFASKEISAKISLLITAWDELDEDIKKDLQKKTPEVYNYLQGELRKIKG